LSVARFHGSGNSGSSLNSRSAGNGTSVRSSSVGSSLGSASVSSSVFWSQCDSMILGRRGFAGDSVSAGIIFSFCSNSCRYCGHLSASVILLPFMLKLISLELSSMGISFLVN